MIAEAFRVKVPRTTAGSLDFRLDDLGRSTFISILQNDGRNDVHFSITLTHHSAGVTDATVQVRAPNIARSMKGFRFDSGAHFTEKWLTWFGYSALQLPRQHE